MKNEKLLIFAMENLSGDLGNHRRNTAQARRMNSIIAGFEDLDISILIISGSRSERRKRAWNLIFDKQYKDLSKIYVESSNTGILFAEFILLAICRLQKIPTGVYIRDAHAKIISYWKSGTFKERVSYLLWIVSLRIYKSLKVFFYFPSKRFQEFMGIPGEILPPALSLIKQRFKQESKNTIFYVGGVGKLYDIDIFLTACQRLQEEIDINVRIFCREYERHELNRWNNYQWISIEHKNFEELEIKPTVGIVPLKKTKYADLAFPVKLLDYIGYGIPVVGTDNATLKEFITQHNIGSIVNSGDVQAYYAALKKMLTNKKYYNEICANVNKLRKSEELTWKSRCEKILCDLEER